MFCAGNKWFICHVIPQSAIDDILSAIHLPDFVGESLPLAHQGASHVGLCPFHEEKTPSFRVFPDHYHCYGCGAHGNAIDYLMKRQGIGFLDSVRLLAGRVGVTLPAHAQDSGEDAHGRLRETLLKACARYQALLAAPEGAAAKEALAARGVSDASIVRFGIGYAPEAWNTLSGDRAFRREHLLTVGLAVARKEKKGCYDFFRNRIVFPIRDGAGNVVGFGGRRLGEEGPKYLNSPESPIFRKGALLFGLPQARPSILASDSLIVCEGFFDVIAAVQAGVEPIVSTCGTALSQAQARLALAQAKRLYFCFDGDSAGVKATLRTARLLLPLLGDQHIVRMCRLPNGEDPDSLIRTQGVMAFRTLLKRAPTLTDYLVGTLMQGLRSAESKASALSRGADYWREIVAPGLSVFFRQSLCHALAIDPKDFARIAAPPPSPFGQDALRDCPCCGARARIINGRQGIRVRCPACGLSTSSTLDASACRILWNRRTEPQETTNA